MQVTVNINGESVSHDVEPRTLLVHYIRDHAGMTGTNIGCDSSSCGACTVHLDGEAVKSCTILAVQVDGQDVTTIEGLADGATLNGVQQAFVDEQAMQCGYCTPGMILTATALLERNPDPSHAEIVLAMNGNICRCGGYPKIIDAIHRAARGGEA